MDGTTFVHFCSVQIHNHFRSAPRFVEAYPFLKQRLFAISFCAVSNPSREHERRVLGVESEGRTSGAKMSRKQKLDLSDGSVRESKFDVGPSSTFNSNSKTNFLNGQPYSATYFKILAQRASLPVNEFREEFVKTVAANQVRAARILLCLQLLFSLCSPTRMFLHSSSSVCCDCVHRFCGCLSSLSVVSFTYCLVCVLRF